MYQGFIRVFQHQSNKFPQAGKTFKLNFFISKTFLWMVKPVGQEHLLATTQFALSPTFNETPGVLKILCRGN